ncbi:MAG: hypothetical protein AAGJ28_00345 [Pseudomonadota bacterium]
MGSKIETERPLKELSLEIPLNEAFSVPGATGTFSVTPSLSLTGEAIVGAVTSAFTGTNAFDFQSKANFGIKKGGGVFHAGAIVSFDLGEAIALAGPEPGLVEVGLQGHIGFGAKVSGSGSFQFDPHGFSIDDGLSSLKDMIAGYTIDDTELSLGLGFGSQIAWGVGTTGLYSTAEISVVGDITNFSGLNDVAINLDVNFNYGFFVGSVDVNFNQSVPVKPVIDFILNKVPFGGLIGVSGKAALPSSTIRSVVTETLFGYEIASYSVITNPDGSLSVAGGYGAQLAALDLASVGQTVYGQYGNGFGFGGLTATSPGVGVDSSGGYHYSPRATLSLIDQLLGTDFAGAPPLGSNRGPDYSPPAPNAVDRALADLHDLIQTRLGLRDRTNDPGGSVGDSNLGAPPGTDRGESDRSGNQSGRQSGREGGGRESGGREGNSNLPIILDLDGNGIEITELSRSTVFIDGTDDGLSNRTAWAAAGDGVLFYDPDNTNQITEKRQYVFTEWDPTAASDIDALRSIFDSNGDGVLDASDAAFAQFKVMVTSADYRGGHSPPCSSAYSLIGVAASRTHMIACKGGKSAQNAQ